jgi:hypothetical protein
MSFLMGLISSIFGIVFKTLLTTERKTYSTKSHHGKIKIETSVDRVLAKYRHLT